MLAGAGIAAEASEIRNFLVHSALRGLVTFWHQPPVAAQEPGAHPRASRLARLEAALGGLTTTAYHQRVDVSDPVLRRMITLMDGRCEFESIVAQLRAEFAGDPAVAVPEFGRQACRSLKLLAAGGLLVDTTGR
jgi:hypothetical protein